MGLEIGKAYKTKKEMVFFIKNMSLLRTWDHVKIPKGSIVLVVAVEQTVSEKYKLYSILWENKISYRELSPVILDQWFEEVKEQYQQ